MLLAIWIMIHVVEMGISMILQRCAGASTQVESVEVWYNSQAKQNTTAYHNHKLQISIAPTKQSHGNPDYSHALNQNKIKWEGLKVQRVR